MIEWAGLGQARSRAGWSRAGLLALILVLCAGCATGSALLKPGARQARVEGARVLLMEPDVVLSTMTAGGLEEPRADWTEQGLRHVRQAIGETVRQRSAILVPYRVPADPDTQRMHTQLQKLHEAVGISILRHRYVPALALPTKSAQGIEWTLGDGVSALREGFGADYALFVYLHDSYSTGGRVATMIVAAALGVGLGGGVQRGFASLIDLRSGDIVWFNRLVSGSGDLRTMEPARTAVTALLTDVPL